MKESKLTLKRKAQKIRTTESNKKKKVYREKLKELYGNGITAKYILD